MRKEKAELHLHMHLLVLVCVPWPSVPTYVLYEGHADRVSSAECIPYNVEDEGSVRSDGVPALAQLLSLS